MKKNLKCVLTALVCSMMLCCFNACEDSKEETKPEKKTETYENIESTPTPEVYDEYAGREEDYFADDDDEHEEGGDGWSSDKFQGPWTKTVEAEPTEAVKPDWLKNHLWIEEDEYAVLYENEGGQILAVFKKEDNMLVAFDQMENDGTVWYCDWIVTDVRNDENEFQVGYEIHDVENGTYSNPIYACWDLDFKLEWPNGYYDDIQYTNQQYVTVNGDTFNLIWAEDRILTKSYSIWKRYDNVYTKVDIYKNEN